MTETEKLTSRRNWKPGKLSKGCGKVHPKNSLYNVFLNTRSAYRRNFNSIQIPNNLRMINVCTSKSSRRSESKMHHHRFYMTNTTSNTSSYYMKKWKKESITVVPRFTVASGIGTVPFSAPPNGTVNWGITVPWNCFSGFLPTFDEFTILCLSLSAVNVHHIIVHSVVVLSDNNEIVAVFSFG